MRNIFYTLLLIICGSHVFVSSPISADEASRSWGDTFLPKSPTPARQIQVVHVYRLSADERIAITCLQSLVAREKPSIFLLRSEDDIHWLDWHKAKGYIDGYETVDDWKSLFTRHRHLAAGAVVPDRSLYQGDLIALNVASCEDLIVASQPLAAKLGLPVKIDLRDRFTTYNDGLKWIWSTYQKRLNPHLCDFRAPGLIQHGTFDYAFQWRGLMFWISGSKDSIRPGASPQAELQTVSKILSQMPAGGVCVGFPALGEGEGIGEPPGVKLLSRYGKSLVCTNHRSNYSLLSGFRIARFTQPKQPPAPALDKKKIYIALVLSDGDNQILWPRFFRQFFEHPSHGKFPLAFGMGPAIRELQPGVARWYYEHARPTTELIADVSGAGYMHPDHFAVECDNPDRVWSEFLSHTRRLMSAADLRTIRTVGGADRNIERYVRALPECHSIFADMGRYSGREGIDNLTYMMKLDDANEMPVFRAVTSWRYGKEGFYREVREQVGEKRPAFVNGFVHCWTFGPDDIARIYENRDDDIVFVTPSQLAELYREATKM